MAKAESNTDDVISANERKFILDAIAEKKRIDGRGFYDYRPVKLTFGSTWGRVQVQLGQTRVLIVVSCEVVKPYPDRPTEGFLKFNISFSPMASPAFGGRVSSQGVEIGRIVERGLRESGAIDTEALCIVAGEKVWSVRLDMHVLDDHGNIGDCCSIGAITALHHFRRPDVTISGDAVVVHPITEREPVPLSVHHMPICISFAVFDDGVLIVDPNWKEDKVCLGHMAITLNAQHELCAMQKAGGVPMTVAQVLDATKIAQMKVIEITEAIHEALKQDKTKRKTSKVSSTDFMTSGIGLEQLEPDLVLGDAMDMDHPTRALRFFHGAESLTLPDLQPGDEEYEDYDDSDIDEMMSQDSATSSSYSQSTPSPAPVAAKKGGPIVKQVKSNQKPTDILKGSKAKPIVAAKVQREKAAAATTIKTEEKTSSTEGDKQKRNNKQSFEQFAAHVAEKNAKKKKNKKAERSSMDLDDSEEETVTLHSEHVNSSKGQ